MSKFLCICPKKYQPVLSSKKTLRNLFWHIFQTAFETMLLPVLQSSTYLLIIATIVIVCTGVVRDVVYEQAVWTRV